MNFRGRGLGFLCRLAAKLGGGPWLVSVTATVVAVILAIIPGGMAGGDYNAELAVLTATLIAIIWYVYFTFRLARDPGNVSLDINPNATRNALYLRPRINNRSDRRLHISIYLRIQIDDQPVELPKNVYRGSQLVRLEPHRSWMRSRQLPIHEHYAGTFQRDQHHEAWVLMCLKWVNDACEPGSRTVCWKINLQTTSTNSVDEVALIEEHFGLQPDWCRWD